MDNDNTKTIKMAKATKARSKSKPKPKLQGRMKNKSKYRLTVAKDKLAVLLRLPKSTVKIIDSMAKAAGNGAKRTSVLYDIIGAHPKLSESMQPLRTNVAKSD